MEIKVRFAPSPTGYLHVGGARTAVFNWLFARNKRGKFLLRIEDTDFERSSEEMISGILEGLRWLGIDWDEEPLYQSKRIEFYKKWAEELIKMGKAYYCYCLPEEIEKRKKEFEREGGAWKYDRRCLHLTEEEKTFYEKERKRAIRFLVPKGKTKWFDLVHKDIEFDNRNIEDFVLLRADEIPTYHLSVVLDDWNMGITHVIRGDDHLSNTPKQILLYEAFKFPVPQFAHLPLILGPDRKKLSKRHGVTSILNFKEEGYLPLAMLNFLAQLSWSPGEEKDFFTTRELIKKFSIEKVSHGSPVFDLNKLEWINSKVISNTSSRKLFDTYMDFLEKESISKKEFYSSGKKWILKVIDLFKERARTIKELAINTKPIISDFIYYEPEAVEKHLKFPDLDKYLEKLTAHLEKIETFTASEVEKVFREFSEKEKIKAASLIHATRVAVTGKRVSPSLFEVLELIGKEKTIFRVKKLVEFIKSHLLQGGSYDVKKD
ncbi:MAG: glutamate--tRNA ligase [Acidobacteriota bacterium]